MLVDSTLPCPLLLQEHEQARAWQRQVHALRQELLASLQGHLWRDALALAAASDHPGSPPGGPSGKTQVGNNFDEHSTHRASPTTSPPLVDLCFPGPEPPVLGTWGRWARARGACWP